MDSSIISSGYRIRYLLEDIVLSIYNPFPPLLYRAPVAECKWPRRCQLHSNSVLYCTVHTTDMPGLTCFRPGKCFGYISHEFQPASYVQHMLAVYSSLTYTLYDRSVHRSINIPAFFWPIDCLILNLQF